MYGPIGSGKTSLVRRLQEKLGQDERYNVKLLLSPNLKSRVFKRRQRVFAIAGLTWIVERSFAWLGFNRRLAKDYEHRVQTSETLISIAAIRLMLNRIAPA